MNSVKVAKIIEIRKFEFVAKLISSCIEVVFCVKKFLTILETSDKHNNRF